MKKKKKKRNEKTVVIVQGQLMDPVRIHRCILGVEEEAMTYENRRKKLVDAFLFFFMLSTSGEREGHVILFERRTRDHLTNRMLSFIY